VAGSASSTPASPAVAASPGGRLVGGGPRASEDPVLSSYARCLEAELLVVWRRVPKRALVTYTYDISGNQVREGTFTSFSP